jgi:hypothetical protein
MLPADGVSSGFDNIAGVPRMSPTLMERYLAAAQKISGVSVGASVLAPTTDTFQVPPELRQDDRLEGLPFGTRGGTAISYTFPRDGEYNIRLQLTRYAGASFDEVPTFDQSQRLEFSLDGAPLHVFELAPDSPIAGRGYSASTRRVLDADWHVRFPSFRPPYRRVAFLNRTSRCSKISSSPSRSRFPAGPTDISDSKGSLPEERRSAPTHQRPGDTQPAANSGVGRQLSDECRAPERSFRRCPPRVPAPCE